LLCWHSNSDCHQNQKHARHPFQFHVGSLLSFIRLASALLFRTS
jgi:hypothetical protein